MPWPAWYRTVYQSGTCYIDASWFPSIMDRYKHSGQAWRYKTAWTTYRPNGKVSFKAIDRLKIESEEDFWRIMGCAESVNMNPPTSFSDIFLHAYHHPFPRKSILAPFHGRVFGGWQQVRQPGLYTKGVWHYDIIKAYRWAALRGLPDVKTAYRTWDGTHPNAIYLFELPKGAMPWIRHAGKYVVTSEERDMLLKRPTKILYGVAFRENISLDEVFGFIDIHFPYCRDRISQSFWGLWNSFEGPQRLTFKSGPKVYAMGNPFYNPVWSAFITSRVKLRLLHHWDKSLHCFVDSLLLTEPIEEGTAMGDFKLVNEYSTVWIEGPGIWGTGDILIKHSGRKTA